LCVRRNSVERGGQGEEDLIRLDAVQAHQHVCRLSRTRPNACSRAGRCTCATADSTLRRSRSCWRTTRSGVSSSCTLLARL
jgi:hypothetical protein